jgi:hypothetical protein
MCGKLYLVSKWIKSYFGIWYGFSSQFIILLSDILFFVLMHSKTSLFFPSTSQLSFPPLCVSLVCVFAFCCMPRSRETRLQIQKHTAREIRNRTAARIAKLYREAENGRQRIEGNRIVFNIVEGDIEGKGLPGLCKRCRRLDPLCYRLCCFFLFLFFAYYLYRAYKKR